MEERAASQLVCCRLAEPSPEGGTEGRHLTSRVRCGHARCRTSTPWLYERQNPSRGRACGCCCLNTQLAEVSVVAAREGSLKSPLPHLSFHPGSLHFGHPLVSSVGCPYPPLTTRSCVHRSNNTNHGDNTARDAALAEKGSGLRLCLSSRR